MIKEAGAFPIIVMDSFACRGAQIKQVSAINRGEDDGDDAKGARAMLVLLRQLNVDYNGASI
jgi:hypothetical protein